MFENLNCTNDIHYLDLYVTYIIDQVQCTINNQIYLLQYDLYKVTQQIEYVCSANSTDHKYHKSVQQRYHKISKMPKHSDLNSKHDKFYWNKTAINEAKIINSP